MNGQTFCKKAILGEAYPHDDEERHRDQRPARGAVVELGVDDVWIDHLFLHRYAPRLQTIRLTLPACLNTTMR